MTCVGLLDHVGSVSLRRGVLSGGCGEVVAQAQCSPSYGLVCRAATAGEHAPPLTHGHARSASPLRTSSASLTSERA